MGFHKDLTAKNCFFLLFRVFKRVLPLPNGNWNAIVDDWCCHPDPFAKKLLPRAEDCLLGDTFLLVARDGSCEETLTQEMNPVGAEDGQDPKVSRSQGTTAGDFGRSFNLCFDPNYLLNGSSCFFVLSSKSLTFIITSHVVMQFLPHYRS